MKNYTVIFIISSMLAIAFTTSVFPQKKKNLPNRQMSIQEKRMKVELGLHVKLHGNHNDELFPAEERFSSLQQLVRRETNFSKILFDTTYVRISDVVENWDTLANAWVNVYKYTYSYYANGNRSEDYGQYWISGAWVSSWKNTYTYDANGNLTQELSTTWNGSAWVNNDKWTYTYDVNGNFTGDLYQTWNGSAWVNYWKGTPTYNANGYLAEFLWQDWNGSAWVNSWKYIYTYDGSWNLTDETDLTWNGSAWVNDWKYIYVYDAYGNETNEYDQTWSGSAWVNNYKYTYTYNANGNLTEYLYQTWNGSAWVNSYKYTYSFDANGNTTGYVSQKWKISAWVNYSKRTYTLQMIITDINEQANAVSGFVLSSNYPNPFNPQTNISFSVPKESYISLKVYDMLGREVATLVQEKKEQGEYSVTWGAEGVPSGIYFYRLMAIDPSLHSGNVFIETKKMILMK